MDPGSREEKQSLAFLDILAAERSLKLRPSGYMAFLNISLLGLSFAKGKEEGGQIRQTMSGSAVIDEMHAVYFLQAGPPKVVALALRQFRLALATQSRAEAFEWFMTEYVDPFLIDLPDQKKKQLDAQIAAYPEIEAARVKALPPLQASRRTLRIDPHIIEPHWLAARIIALSESRPWSESFIAIWLPLARGEQYYHALLRRAGCRTYLPPVSIDLQLTQIESVEAELPEMEDDPELAEAVRRFGLDTPSS